MTRVDAQERANHGPDRRLQLCGEKGAKTSYHPKGLLSRLTSTRRCIIIRAHGKSAFWLRTPPKRAEGQSDFL